MYPLSAFTVCVCVCVCVCVHPNCNQELDEKIVWINGRTADADTRLSIYTKPPYNLRILGDAGNYGIGDGIMALISAARNEHVIFLEKDFQLIESLRCTVQHLQTAVDMLDVRDERTPCVFASA
jgi:hypothetical protein